MAIVFQSNSGDASASGTLRGFPIAADVINYFGKSSMPSAQRLKNWGSAAQDPTLVGIAALSDVGLVCNGSATGYTLCLDSLGTAFTVFAVGKFAVGTKIFSISDIASKSFSLERGNGSANYASTRIFRGYNGTLGQIEYLDLPGDETIVYAMTADSTGFQWHLYYSGALHSVAKITSAVIPATDLRFIIGGSANAVIGGGFPNHTLYAAVGCERILSNADIITVSAKITAYAKYLGATVYE